MSVFSTAINDIFSVSDFCESLTAGNAVITVISYAGEQAEKYSEFGYDEGRAISVTVKCSDWSPSRGDAVTFRNKSWKVSTISTDSHNLTHTVYLKSVESK